MATLRTAHVAFAKPARDAPSLVLVETRRPLTGVRTVLPVLGRSTGAEGVRWLHVRLPGRPNGRTGWIKERGTSTSTTRWHIVVRTSTRRVTVYRDGRPARVFRAVVGSPSTPTPHG